MGRKKEGGGEGGEERGKGGEMRGWGGWRIVAREAAGRAKQEDDIRGECMGGGEE